MASKKYKPRHLNKVSVLFLSPKWQCHGNTMANITRSLIEDLHKVDSKGLGIEKVCCLIEEGKNISQKDVGDAAMLNVNLMGAKLPRSKRSLNIKPSIDWLVSNAATYYRHIAEQSNFDFIIGHIPYLANGALDIKEICEERGYSPKLVQVVHSLLKKTDGNIDESRLKEWLSEVDIVLSVGETMKLQIDHYIDFLDVGKPVNMVYIPGCPVDLFKLERRPATQPIQGPQHITLITGGKNELVNNGMDYDLGVAASAKATTKILQQSNANQCVSMNLFLVGNHEEEREEWGRHFKSTLNESSEEDKRLSFEYQTSGTNERLKGILRRTSLCILPLQPNSTVFGLEALMAGYAGVPLLVAKHSGIAEILHRNFATESTLYVKGNSTDVVTWRDGITRKVLNAKESSEEAIAIQECLKKDTSIAQSHLKFITAMIEKACVLLRMELNPGSEKTKLEQTMQRLGISTQSEDITIDATIVQTLNYFLCQDEKVRAGLLDDILPWGVKKAWEELLDEFENNGGKLVGVDEGSIILRIYCPNKRFIKNLHGEKDMDIKKDIKKAIKKFLTSLGYKIEIDHLSVISDNSEGAGSGRLVTVAVEDRQQTSDVPPAPLSLTIEVEVPQTVQLDDMTPNNLVKDIKEKIKEIEGIPVEEQKLTYAGKELNDAIPLREYSIQSGATLHVYPKDKIYIRTLTGKTLKITIHEGQTVGGLKQAIYEEELIPVESQRLIFAGRQLEDGRTLSGYNIKKDHTVHMLVWQ